MTAVDVAWAAGLYEGEGTFFYCKHYYKNGQKIRRKTMQPLLRILMTDKDVLEKWQSIFGGRIDGPRKRQESHYKDQWMLRLDDREKFKAAVIAMWEHLSPRRREQFKGRSG
jgi:hypothetical protein